MSLLTTLKSLFGFGSKSATLAPGDRMLSCADCEQQFVFDAGEQKFFKEKGFSDPKRCPKCRKKVRSRMRRRGRGGGSGGGGGSGPSSKATNGHRGHHGRRHSVIDGDSPYVDER